MLQVVLCKDTATRQRMLESISAKTIDRAEEDCWDAFAGDCRQKIKRGGSSCCSNSFIMMAGRTTF